MVPNETTIHDYDEVGNWPLLNVGGSQTSYVYDSMNRLTQAANIYYYWDSNGNLKGVTKGQDILNYTYDFENTLTSVRLIGKGGETLK